MPTDLNQPIAGRHVHYVLPASSGNAGRHRAAHVTSEHGGPTCNLIVDLDQAGDIGPGHPYEPSMRVWSAPFEPKGNVPGTWHWMEGTKDFTDSQPVEQAVAAGPNPAYVATAEITPPTFTPAPPVFTPAVTPSSELAAAIAADNADTATAETVSTPDASTGNVEASTPEPAAVGG